MQRFPSSMEIVREKVVEIMQMFQKTQLTHATIDSTTKTSQKTDMFLNKQLILWLVSFGWRDFAFGQRFYQRATETLNFGMYSLRRGAMTEADIFLYRTDVGLLSNHVSRRNTDYYLVELRKFKNK